MSPAILRFSPGECAPWEGTYALVGHYGEATGIVVACTLGARLPLIPVVGVETPLWFVFMDEPVEASAAA